VGPLPTTYRISRALFLRLLALCLGSGFLALWHQAPGLIGSSGITPLAATLDSWTRAYGSTAFWHAPTLFWLSTADAFLRAVVLVGLAASALLFAGIAPRACCIVGYVAWLSFRSLDRGPICWFNSPYDDLQTEALFLGIFVAPGTLWPWSPQPEVPRWVRLLLLWLQFRLLFGPGITKVLYYAPWRDLSAVGDFLLTMPHPTAAAAWFRELPPWCLRSMTAFTLFNELLVPFALLVPGWPRRVAAASSACLMVGIQVVCNIRGFNLLTIGLLLWSWDDASLRRLVPSRWRRQAAVAMATSAPQPGRLRRTGAAAVMALSCAASIGPFASQFGWSLAEVSPVAGAMNDALAPFHIASCYSMFCVLPSQRLGFVVQGSRDGETWHDYELIGTPSRVDRPPRFFAPYHDYLGFRLWLAGFFPPEADAWLLVLQKRLLAGDPAVVHLFRAAPFEDTPPEWVRMLWCRFRFASPERRAAGVFWEREEIAIRIAAVRRQV